MGLDNFIGGLMSQILSHEEMSILVSIITLALNGPFVNQGFQEKVIRVFVWNLTIIIQMMYCMVCSESTSDLG